MAHTTGLVAPTLKAHIFLSTKGTTAVLTSFESPFNSASFTMFRLLISSNVAMGTC